MTGPGRIEGFGPVADGRCRVLVLGTMPSVKSLQRGQYYGNPQNAFWPILFALWDRHAPADYAARLAFARERGVALWDVVGSCQRPGSADADIRFETPNPVGAFLAEHPAITHVFTNGKGAYRLLRKHQPGVFAAYPVAALAATSPAWARPFAEKLASWAALRAALEEGTR